MLKPKRGDTLIEVTIAIGIFSMIAITIAAVMSSGTSGSQLALETTLARAEIDAQAEAIRFVHSSYLASQNDKESQEGDSPVENPYQQLWQAIIANAITVPKGENITDITQFAPNTCDELYTEQTDPYGPRSDIFQQNAFVLNTKKLSDGKAAYYYANDSKNSSVFASATTYPRLLFTKSGGNEESGSLLADEAENQLYRAEGIYVIAVKDGESTQIIQNGNPTNTSAFYDFYIRTCWYGTDTTRPSTISTLVRLYNPDIQPTKP